MRYRVKLSSVFLGLVVLFLSQAIARAIVITPQDLSPGDQYRLVFVTTEVRNASSSVIEDYNGFVRGVADSSAPLVSLATDWTVLGSTPGDDAKANTGTAPSSVGVPVYNLGGLLVANDNADLWDGAIANPINVAQNGSIVEKRVFTGTAPDGTAIFDRELGANGARVNFGHSYATSSEWTNITWDWSGSLNNYHFYAISDVLEVPEVPEPATMLLLGLGGMVVRKRIKS